MCKSEYKFYNFCSAVHTCFWCVHLHFKVFHTLVGDSRTRNQPSAIFVQTVHFCKNALFLKISYRRLAVSKTSGSPLIEKTKSTDESKVCYDRIVQCIKYTACLTILLLLVLIFVTWDDQATVTPPDKATPQTSGVFDSYFTTRCFIFLQRSNE